MRGIDEDAPHRGALLARLLRHVAHHVLHEEVPRRGAGLHVGAEDGGVERVGLDVQAHAAPAELIAQLRRRLRRAGEGDHVLRAEPVEEVAGRSAEELKAPARQQRRADLGQAPGDQRGRGRGFGNHRHSRQQRAGRLFRRAPRREVEGIDVHGDAVARHPEVHAGIASGAAQLDRFAVAQRVQRSELGAQLRVMGQCGDGAVDVELGVAARVAPVGDGEADQLVARGVERLAPGAQQFSSLGKRQFAQGGRAGRARVLERRAHLDAAGRGLRQRLFGRGIHQRREGRVAGRPAILHVAAQRLHVSVPWASRAGAASALPADGAAACRASRRARTP